MGSRTARTLVATAPDGTEITKQTSASHDTAGLIQRTDGTWVIVASGWSHASVYNRTHTLYNRGDYQAMHVGDLVEQTAPVIREFFGTHQVIIDSAYSPGTHQGLTENGLREILWAAGSSLGHMRSAIAVATSHPGKNGSAGVQVSSGIASISYDGASFTLERLGAGWYATGLQGAQASRSFLRALARNGWTSVAVRAGTRVADFQVSELLKSMNARKAG